MLLILFEPMPLGKALLLFGLIFIVVSAVGLVVGYFLLKGLAGILNSRRDEWAETAQTLGLEMQMEYVRLQKPLKGVYKNHAVEVTHEAAGETSHTVGKVQLIYPLPFYVHIKPQNALNWFAGSLGSGDIETGVDAFDKHFWVEGGDEDVQKFLSLHLGDDGKPNLIAEMLAFKREGYLLELTGDQIKATTATMTFEVYPIQTMLDRAVHLAERIEKIRLKMIS